MRNISKLMQLHVVWHIHQFQVFLWHSMSSICHVFNTYFFLTQLFNNFFFFAICKIWLHSWYHLIRVWRTLEVFGDGRHFDFLLQLCCLFWFWSFTSNMESTEIRIFECSSRGMRQWEKKYETAALQNDFGRTLQHRFIHWFIQWKWSHLLPHLLVHVIGMFIKSRHGKIQRKIKH